MLIKLMRSNVILLFLHSVYFILFSYVHGIGSETRNSLFHLYNSRDLVLVTTCRHGKSWRELQDARCDEDNREYDRYFIISYFQLHKSV